MYCYLFFDFHYVCLHKIHHYVSELNNLESRKGRKPLDVNNVVYWFKNARAAQKRAEVRGANSGQYL
jgi:homeobox domain-containing protein